MRLLFLFLFLPFVARTQSITAEGYLQYPGTQKTAVVFCDTITVKMLYRGDGGVALIADGKCVRTGEIVRELCSPPSTNGVTFSVVSYRNIKKPATHTFYLVDENGWKNITALVFDFH